MIDKARPSVVRIQDSQGSGTGFFINADGLVVTAKHVISNDLSRPCLPSESNTSLATRISIYVPAPRIEVEGFHVGNVLEGFPATVVACDDKHDIAVLKAEPNPFTPMRGGVPLVRSRNVNIDHPSFTPPSAVMFSSKHFRDGDPIFMPGYPLTNLTLVTSSGYVASSAPLDLDEASGKFFDVYLADMRSNFGNSGGPVFAQADGTLMGMADQVQLAPVSGATDSQFKQAVSIDGFWLKANAGISVLIPAIHIRELLQAKGLHFSASNQ
jgi:S1-C subfamily serine protease